MYIGVPQYHIVSIETLKLTMCTRLGPGQTVSYTLVHVPGFVRITITFLCASADLECLLQDFNIWKWIYYIRSVPFFYGLLTIRNSEYLFIQIPVLLVLKYFFTNFVNMHNVKVIIIIYQEIFEVGNFLQITKLLLFMKFHNFSDVACRSVQFTKFLFMKYLRSD